MLQGMSYWVRLPTSGPLGSKSSPNLMHESADEAAQQELSLTRPIVFLHGVGLGLVSAHCLCLQQFARSIVLVNAHQQHCVSLLRTV